MSLIRSDEFPVEFLSQLAERESWRKEIHRPIYHVHKWWAKRLGSIFRGIILGAAIDDDLEAAFYKQHSLSGLTVFDPFMGSGTTLGETHKLGATALGMDINPVAVEAVRVGLGPLNKHELLMEFSALEQRVGPALKALYRSEDQYGRRADVLYYFWVMQAACPQCNNMQDMFSNYVFGRNAYPKRKPEVQVLCPECGEVFQSFYDVDKCTCPKCKVEFDPYSGPVLGGRAVCRTCKHSFRIVKALNEGLPTYRQYAKLLLTESGQKVYLKSNEADTESFEAASSELKRQVAMGEIEVPDLKLEPGHNTSQAMRYGFRQWRDFFNCRQLLGLAMLRRAIMEIEDIDVRRAMLTLFSGTLEFNNLFASYKGEGTGAVRHMFSHHVLKPERTPIEANIWGTAKSSGSFSGLFRSRLLRASEYQSQPTEVASFSKTPVVASKAFAGQSTNEWSRSGSYPERAILVTCGDSSQTGLAESSIDLVVTDPPFFDNVHYSELADFFRAWQFSEDQSKSTRNNGEVQDGDADSFSLKLGRVFSECGRVLKEGGLLIFSYHHSRADGWRSVAKAVIQAGFVFVNSHPVKAEMSVAIPKLQATSPIQLDVILVCEKQSLAWKPISRNQAVASAIEKVKRLRLAGFKLSENDCRVILQGQLLCSVRSAADWSDIREDELCAVLAMNTPSITPQAQLQPALL